MTETHNMLIYLVICRSGLIYDWNGTQRNTVE